MRYAVFTRVAPPEGFRPEKDHEADAVPSMLLQEQLVSLAASEHRSCVKE
jgi:hypothetical protein